METFLYFQLFSLRIYQKNYEIYKTISICSFVFLKKKFKIYKHIKSNENW